MMRRSSGRCTGYCPCCPGRDVKYLARELLCSRALSALCAQPVWGEQANRDVKDPTARGRGVGVAAPGFAPGRLLGHILLRDAWLLFHQAALVAEAGFEPAFSRL